MTQTMSRPWSEIRRVYVDVPTFAWTDGMLALIDRLSDSSLHAWTSMFDLCVTRMPAIYPHEGPMIRVSPVPDTGLLELRWSNDQAHVIPASDSIVGFERLANEHSWQLVPRHGA